VMSANQKSRQLGGHLRARFKAYCAERCCRFSGEVVLPLMVCLKVQA
jgi:hypothetical protein